MYQKATKFLRLFFSDSILFKYGFNISPMYRRTTGRITFVADDLLQIDVKIPISIKNKNYVGSIFGGSLYAATDPIFMIQLIHILGDNYVVWDKASTVQYKRPAYSNAFATFRFTSEEIAQIKSEVTLKKELEIVKNINITDINGTVYTELTKTLYIADKDFYREKKKIKQTSQ
jgi:hypothetical protein